MLPQMSPGVKCKDMEIIYFKCATINTRKEINVQHYFYKIKEERKRDKADILMKGFI